MNFRLPFQISRVSAICQSSSPLNLISKFTPIYGSHVKNTNQDKQKRAHHTRIITTKCLYKKCHSPFNIFQQKAFLHDLAKTEEAVKQRVRYEQGCDCQIEEEPKLAFRQTSKVECIQCIDRKPCLAPPLIRPVKLYDDSKCLYKHKCNPDMCNRKPPRMDDFCCLCIEKKKLPEFPATLNCCPCMDIIKKPLLAPKLCPPPKWYDPDKLKWNHGDCTKPKCVRRDEVCGFKVLPKELPPIPPNNCKPCVAVRPLTAPNLRRPVLRYDPTCIPYPHSDCPCHDEPCRRDTCLCEPIYRELPVLPCSHCVPCEQPLPTKCPELRRPKARYNAMEMGYKHVDCPESPCDTPSLRRDNNIISVTLTRKKLPPLRCDNTCQPCQESRPLTAPALGRPTPYNNNIAEEQKRSHCVEDKCIRRDGEIKICRQCLPRVPISCCARPCMDIFTPCTTPKFVPPKKLYDDSTCPYRHTCPPEDCNDPPRMDDYCCNIIRKRLPKPPNSPDCKPCIQCPNRAPKLCRLQKRYDDTKQKYRHAACPEDPCETTPRADKITGIKDEVKCLQPYKALKCRVCQQYFPFRAPKLCRPRARYDDTCMLYDHKNCPPPCDGACFRRDHYIWEGPKKLPRIKCGTICEECQQPYPSVAPPIERPKKMYEFPEDPVRIKECPPECPPRRDDLFCWKPRRKKLPSFRDCCNCNQSCCFSTFSWVSSKKNPISPTSSKCASVMKKEEPGIKSQLKKEASTKKSDKKKFVLKENNKTKQEYPIQPEGPYYIVEKPTWKCIDVSNEKKSPKLYDYSIEKWLRKGAEYLISASPKSKSKKRSIEHACNQLDYPCKYSTETKCITPLKFTGFDTSATNKLLFIKKDNKLQPLKMGSAFKSEVSSSKAQMCIPKNCKTTSNENKITSTSKENNKQFMITSIIQEHIKQRIPTTYHMRTNNFVLNLNNTMRSTLFQKISNFFKNREKAAKNAIKQKPNVIMGRDNTALNKEFIDNICEKYNVDFEPSHKVNMERNKAYFVQKSRNNTLKMKTDRPANVMSSRPKTANNKKDETSKATRSLPKNIKIKTDQIRNFSTKSKGGALYYKHIDISDDYIGKIYKVKLKKIGVKNLMLEKNDPDKRDEEPHTICYICKVVPRYQPIVHDDPPDIENVKINYYREKRNTIE